MALRYKKAFTLAETLLALVIIGIVIAMVMPVFTKRITKRVYISALNKNYSVFSNAFNLAKKFDYNDYEDWTHDDSNTFYNYQQIKKYFSIIRECNNEAGCWSVIKTKAADGSELSYANDTGIGSNNVTFTLNDGTNVSLAYFNQGETTQSFGVNKFLLSASMIIFVDVNGDKGPNRMGIDVYPLVLTNRGIIPAGANNGSENCKTTGLDCSAKYIKDFIDDKIH